MMSHFFRRFLRGTFAGTLLLWGAGSTFAQTPTPVSVLTRSYNNQRTGANSAETVLNTANVNVNQFGRLFARQTDGEVYAQPLYLPSLNIAGGVHNVLFVATMNDSIYAFDADDANQSAPLWKTSYLQTIDGVNPVAVTTLPVPTSDVGFNCGTYRDISSKIGILSTPVINTATGTMYVVARTKETGGASGNYVQRLHVVDITTGLDKTAPVVIGATYPKTAGGVVTFDPLIQNQRCALLLDHGNLIIAWSSHCDSGSYHGWVISYNAQTLAQNGVWCSTPDGSLGGIWQSGQGLSADAAGNLYFAVGNGSTTVTSGGTGYSNALVKLAPGGPTGLTASDWFMPYNTTSLNNADLDSACGITLVPGGPSGLLAIMGSKGGYCYICDAANLGHYNPNNAGAPQNDFQIVGTFQVASRHIHGSAAYFPGPTGTFIYMWGEYSALRAYQFNGTTFASTPASQTPYNAPNGMPGGTITVSSNGTAPGTGIVWTNLPWSGDANQAVVPGVLRAFDAADMTHELWNTHQNVSRDDFGSYAKYCPPVVTNGKVYMATFSNQVVAYGVLPPVPAPFAPSNLAATGGNQAIALTWTAGTYASSYNVKRSLASSGPFTMIASNISATSYLNTGLVNGTRYYYTVSSVNNIGESADSAAASAVPTAGTGGSGNGLTGKYYTGHASDFSAETGTPILTRTDAVINFNYRNTGLSGSPVSWPSGLPRTNFTAAWTGQILPPVSGTYTFTTVSDDGIRVSLDTGAGLTPIINNPTDHGPTTDTSAGIGLLGGRKYNVKVEFFQDGGQSTCQFFWAYTGQAQQIVPQSALFSQFGTTVSGRIALEGVANMSTTSVNAPLGSFAVEFRVPGTTTVIYAANAALTPAEGAARSGSSASVRFRREPTTWQSRATKACGRLQRASSQPTSRQTCPTSR